MPVAGKDPSKALKLAEEMLAKETAAGTILFVTGRDCREVRACFCRA